MDIGRVGYHAGFPLDISIKRGYDVGVRVFQIFLGTPRRYTVPDSYVIRKLKEDFVGIEVVVHSPYWVSLGKSPSGVQWQTTLGYTVKIAEELDKAGVKYYVTHVGARDSDVVSAMRSMVGFCQQWLWRTEGSKVILCLENDSGSKMGTKLGPVKILERVIREVNSDRVRMTFDCLDRREKIRTSDGFITVSELFSKYNKGEIVEVVSWDGKKEVIRPVSFVARRKVESGELVYHVDSVLGRVNCSEKHKFMTPKGIKLARELVGGDFVYSSEEGLDDLQKQILYGTLAGDTCLGFTKNWVRLQLQQGVKQEKYLDFKCKVFSNLRLTKKIKVVSKRKDGSDAVNFKVVSRCNESLREFERVCYKNGKRFFSIIVTGKQIGR